MIFSKGVYDKLKFLAQIVLPALGTLYASISGLLHWPNTEEVAGVVLAVDTFLGVILGLSAASYNKSDVKYTGDLVVSDGEDGAKVASLELNDHPDSGLFQVGKDVIFKVREG
jgi:hypothetical protein